MKRKGLILSLALIALSAVFTQGLATTAESDTAAIQAWVDQFVAKWNVADNDGLGPMIAEGAVLMQPKGPVIEGREAILATMAQGYDITVSQQTAAVDEVIPSGDWAYVRGTWNVNPTSAAGPEVQAANGKWSTLMKRGADGAWQISRWMWNQDAEQAPAGG
jgi:ketosteroid isomerase-like protein